MKKIIILGLVLLMVVVFATTVFGRAQKLDLKEGLEDGNVVGFVILNNPSGAVNFVVQVIIENAEPNLDCNIWISALTGTGAANFFPLVKSVTTDSPWYKLGELSTNDDGDGSFHINLKLTEVSGNLTKIVVALNQKDPKLRKFTSEEGEIKIK